MLYSTVYAGYYSLGECYHDEPHTRVLIDRLSINSPLDEPTIVRLPAPYRSDIAQNLLGLLEDRLVYYESCSHCY